MLRFKINVMHSENIDWQKILSSVIYRSHRVFKLSQTAEPNKRVPQTLLFIIVVLFIIYNIT